MPYWTFKCPNTLLSHYLIPATAAVAEAKQRVWEEFGKAMEKDFLAVPKEFFGDLLNPTQPPSVMETELEDDGGTIINFPG